MRRVVAGVVVVAVGAAIAVASIWVAWPGDHGSAKVGAATTQAASTPEPPVGTTRYPPGALASETSVTCPGGQALAVPQHGGGVYSSLGASIFTGSDGWVKVWCAPLDYVEG
jgi:hypothetical protein